MRFKDEANHGGNAGLGSARDLLEPLKAKYPGITYADLYIFAGKVAIESMGGPDIGFKCGRSDAKKAPTCPMDDKRFSPDGRLPDGGQDNDDTKNSASAQHVRDIFYRMGFNDQEIVALSGGHALGRCHTDRSGYWGPWTRAPTTVSNEYFRLLIEEKWTVKKTHKGKAWTGPMQYEDPSGELMMLPTDMSLTTDAKFRSWTEKYAKDEDLFMKDFGKVRRRGGLCVCVCVCVVERDKEEKTGRREKTRRQRREGREPLCTRRAVLVHTNTAVHVIVYLYVCYLS